jgi:hypothetical protein
VAGRMRMDFEHPHSASYARPPLPSLLFLERPGLQPQLPLPSPLRSVPAGDDGRGNFDKPLPFGATVGAPLQRITLMSFPSAKAVRLIEHERKPPSHADCALTDLD